MNNIGYIPDWSFYLIDKDKNKPPPYSFSVDIAYDFYCCLFYNNKIIQFVIKISDDKTIDSTDIYAMQFNMHILKINKKSNLSKDINRFIKKISTSNKYIISNNDTFKDEFDEHRDIFIKNYSCNRLNYVKYISKNLINEDISDEKNNENSLDEEPDNNQYVSNNVLKKLLKNKMIIPE